MDRQIVYVSQVPMTTDILNTNLNSYIAFSKIASAMLGTSTQLNGLACTENGTPNLTVNVAGGEIYELGVVDANPYGDLPPNANIILKQGINLTTTNVTGFAAPVTVGNSINYLIQFKLTEVDNGSTVLPYYNSADPSQSFVGPANDNLPNYTNRADVVTINVKAGVSATTGTQVTPTPDSGYVGGYVVTVAYGQTTIVNANISTYPGAPFISTPASISNIQSGIYIYAASASSPNTYVATLSPAIAALSTGMHVFIRFTNANTGAATLNLNGLGAKSIKNGDGSALSYAEIQPNQIAVLVYDGTNFQLINPSSALMQNGLPIYASSTTAANTYTASLTPALLSLTAGTTLRVKFTNTNTGSATLNVDGLGAVTIKNADGTNLESGEIASGQVAVLIYDGTNFQLINPNLVVLKTAIQNNSYCWTTSSTAANTYTATLSPVPLAYTTGMEVTCKFTNANTGAATLNLNSLGAKTIKLQNGNDLFAGDIAANYIAELTYDGTNFVLMNPLSVPANYGRKGTSIASASTTDLATATADFIDVTGTTTITALGTMNAGIWRTVRFTGALTLTHNATSLILPGAANITTASDDTAEFRSLGSGDWVCTQYKRASGLPVVGVGAAASQSEQEAAISNVVAVTPAVQQYHPSACKGWVKGTFIGTSIVSYNVSSVSDTATGSATVNWNVAMSSSNYCAVANIILTPGGSAGTTISTHIANNFTTTSTNVISIVLNTFAGADGNAFTCAVFGDQ